MIIRVEDLRKGDVVLIAANGRLQEAKLLRQPRKPKTGRLKLYNHKDRWVSVPCAMRVEEETITYGQGRSYTRKFFTTTESGTKEYNLEERVDFSDRDCWLIKSEDDE